MIQEISVTSAVRRGQLVPTLLPAVGPTEYPLSGYIRDVFDVCCVAEQSPVTVWICPELIPTRETRQVVPGCSRYCLL